MKAKIYLSVIAVVLFVSNAFAQQKIKDGTISGTSSLANSNAILELESASRGLLLPRVALFDTSASRPLNAHVPGMLVYNTNTINSVTPGVYYNDGTKWVRQADLNSGWGLNGNGNTNSGTNFLGTLGNNALRFKVNNVSAGFIDSLNGSDNTAFGYGSLSANTSGVNNTAFGNNALIANSTGGGNTAIGNSALVVATGNGNAAFGFKAGSTITTGTDNLAVGNNAQVALPTGDHQLSIGNLIYGTGLTGDVGAGKIGIGVTAPVSKLQVNASAGVGQITYENGATLASGGKIGSTPVLNSLVVKNPNTYYQQAYISESAGKVGAYETISNLLAFDHFTTSNSLTASNFLLPYGGVGFGHYVDANSSSYPQLGIWYLNDNVMAFGKINGKVSSPATNTVELVTDIMAHKVGIGTTTPAEKLDVSGAVKISSTYTGISNGATTPAPTGGAGTMIFQASDSHFYGWNGTMWKQLDN
ncbi:MAG: hypothetical protein QM726_08415 [Chitinophagaceae bacterium]